MASSVCRYFLLGLCIALALHQLKNHLHLVTILQVRLLSGQRSPARVVLAFKLSQVTPLSQGSS